MDSVTRLLTVVDLDGGAGADLVVTDDPERLPDDGPAVLVTRAALARRTDHDLPDGVMDEAADLASYGDDFTPWAEPEDDDPALRTAGGVGSYGQLVAGCGAAARVQLVDPTAEALLRTTLDVWSRGGSLVVHLGPTDAATLERRARAEGVTA